MDNSNQLNTSTDYSRLLVTKHYTITHTWNATIVSSSASTIITQEPIEGNISHLNISVDGGVAIAGFGVFTDVGSRTLSVIVGLVDGILSSYMGLSGPAGSQTVNVTYDIIATHPIY